MEGKSVKNIFLYRFIIYKVTGGVTDSDSSYETAVNVVNIYCMLTSRTKLSYVVNCCHHKFLHRMRRDMSTRHNRKGEHSDHKF